MYRRFVEHRSHLYCMYWRLRGKCWVLNAIDPARILGMRITYVYMIVY